MAGTEWSLNKDWLLLIMTMVMIMMITQKINKLPLLGGTLRTALQFINLTCSSLYPAEPSKEHSINAYWSVGWMDGWMVDGRMDGWRQFAPISVVDANNTSQSFSLHISNSFPLSYSCFFGDPTMGPRFPLLPPQGNCQTQPARLGPPTVAASHHCNKSSPPGCLSEAAGKIDVLSGSAWKRSAGIKATGMLRGRGHTKCRRFLSV